VKSSAPQACELNLGIAFGLIISWHALREASISVHIPSTSIVLHIEVEQAFKLAT
jgi:hypothetical protein